MTLDPDRCWRAVEAADPRFDGWFFCGVTSTGIYCRPSCPARTPRREHVRFYATAAAAQGAGFRACKRCRPDATPGSPEWDARADLVGRAMRLIADGVVDRDGVGGLAARLGYTERHVHRCLVEAVGAGPLALSRAQRAQTARLLLETTELPVTQVAFAAGFRSVRQFNETIRDVFALAPRDVRSRGRRAGGTPPEEGAIALRLPHRAPLEAGALLGFFAARTVPGVEEVADGAYRRSLRLPHGEGVAELRPAGDHVAARLWLADVRDLGAAIVRCRALLDLDADPAAVLGALGGDAVVGPLVRRAPGLRVPGTVDAHETAVRAVVGQQVSVAGARTVAGRLAAAAGEPLERPLGGVTRLFPDAGALADCAGPMPMPRAREAALRGLCRALAGGDVVLDAGADRAEALARLQALPGIGPWTASYVALRGLRDPDAFLPTDLGVRRALERLGHAARDAGALAESWRPYRASALHHLWAAA